MKYNKQQKKMFIRDFCKGFFITLAVIIPMYVAAYFVRINSLVETEIVPDVVPGAAEPSHEVPLSNDYNLLVMVENIDKAVEEVLLLRFDTQNEMIKSAVFPQNTVLLINKMPSTVLEIEQQLGPFAVKQALEETFSIEVNGYVSLDFDSFLYAIDLFGRFDYLSPSEIEYTAANGNREYFLPQGQNSISANDVVNILKYSRYQDFERLELSEKLAEAFFMSAIDADFGEVVTRIYQKRCNYFSSDISAVGMEILEKSIDSAAGSGVFQTVRVPGDFFEQRFELSDSSNQKISQNFTSE